MASFTLLEPWEAPPPPPHIRKRFMVKAVALYRHGPATPLPPERPETAQSVSAPESWPTHGNHS